ncbi:subtilisin-like protease SBT4.6 [Punica granatum]|uniref:Subtilisin-like protease SBT4.6 n=1 Tax=Punica granatum TaxID=22663 RepID=A0A6P8D108_PUNGR|nr:subtilisin-like protease SBT4.6 [Punica granatum]
MAKDGLFRLSCILSVVLLSINDIACSAQDEERKVYIAYLGSITAESSGTYSLASHQLSLLEEVVGGESSASTSASTSLIRSYQRSFNGFAAKLTEKEAQKLARKEEVLSVFRSPTFHVQTTRSWDFIGLPETAKREPTIEGRTIIGVLDTGAYPDLESFSDQGFGPPPEKWKGSCKGGANFTCNNKLIGARYYVSTEDSAIDGSGHGTHTASTAAGNAVERASLFGLANGTARGGVPSSRIAVYKVCDSQGNCQGDGILAAFDDAIADGVDIITASLGEQAIPFDKDPLAIGAFHAMAKGVLVTLSAGNSGPDAGTVGAVAPWVLTVASNSLDREFMTKLVLGDGTLLTGNTVNPFPSSWSKSALLYGKQVSSTCSEASARFLENNGWAKFYSIRDLTHTICRCNCRACEEGCLDMQKVLGKIVICEWLGTDAVSKAAVYNASGIILKQPLSKTYPLPTVVLDGPSFEMLVSYHSSAKNPQARLLKSETIPNPAPPTVDTISSRGPSMITPDIMKPDVSAPGVNILAAFPPNVPPTMFGGEGDHRSVKFNLLSGTSMSCPHAAGAAAYVKTFHPDWSPSAIKSALMTTASKLQDTITNKDPSGREFSYGSGQINPVKAVDPGLVYEITKDDYVNLLCSLGYDIRSIDSNSTCPRGAKNITEAELNYPSLIFRAPDSKPFKLALNRTATNVGFPNSTYKAEVVNSSNAINITVVPEVLSFKSVSEKKTFTVEITGSGLKSGTQLSEEFAWYDSVHSVRSPIIVYAE